MAPKMIDFLILAVTNTNSLKQRSRCEKKIYNKMQNNTVWSGLDFSLKWHWCVLQDQVSAEALKTFAPI